MQVNGRQLAYRDGLTLHALLEELKVDHRKVVVMRGDDVWRIGKSPTCRWARAT